MNHPCAPLTATDYCRRARRLRSTYAGQPSRLHRALAELAKPATEMPAIVAAPVNTPAAVDRVAVCPAALLGVPPDQERAVRRFVEHVRSCVAARGATGASISRHQLLHVAARLGIGRFHANLVIAAVLHETRAMPFAVDRAPRAKWPFVAALAATQVTLMSALVLGWRWLS